MPEDLPVRTSLPGWGAPLDLDQSPVARRLRARRDFDLLLREAPLDLLDDTEEERCFVAWRIIRHLAVGVRIIPPGHPLSSSDPENWKRLSPPLDLDDEEGLSDWIVGIRTMARALKIDRTPEGRRGLLPLVSKAFASVAWPQRARVLELEELIGWNALEIIRPRSTMNGLRALQEHYPGLGIMEARELMSLAYFMAEAITVRPVEQDKAMAILRNEELAARAEEGMDLRLVASIYKNNAVIQKLATTEVETPQAAFIRSAKQLTDTEANAPAQERLRLLPPENRGGLTPSP